MKTKSLQSIKTILFAFAFMAVALSCKDDKDKDPKPGGGRNAVEGSWKISAITVDPAQNGITDFLAFLEGATGNTCISRTVFAFKGDGTIAGNVPAGCTLDDENPGSITNGTWKVNGSKIELTDGEDVESYDLATSNSEMRWTQNVTEDEVKYKMTIVFKRQ